MRRLIAAAVAALIGGCATAPPPAPAAKNVIFFLGDGMGFTTLTAARMFAVGEAGSLTIDTLPETAFVKTYSNDAQVTDSAAGMVAHMTGVKVNNGVISMSPDTISRRDNCSTGTPVTTLLELARARGLPAGVVTTAALQDATPAATYAHVCHRRMWNEIAAAMVPGGAGFNTKLGDGLEIALGGGSDAFLPKDKGGSRTDGRDLLAEMSARGYTVARDTAQLRAANGRTLGVFAKDDMHFDAERDPAREPALHEMTAKAIDTLSKSDKGFFLMVEGGLIDHGLHETRAKRAFQDLVAFDAAIRTAIERMQAIDPGLKNTLIVVTADHDHTLMLNRYAGKIGPTTAADPGVLGLARHPDGTLRTDLDGAPYTMLGFATGPHRTPGSRASASALTDAAVTADDYHQEAAVRFKGAETHGGTDVFLGAIGAGAERFRGTIENTRTFALIQSAAAPAAAPAGEVRNIVYFVGDGMGPSVVTAARIHKTKEEGLLYFESFDRTARVRIAEQNPQASLMKQAEIAGKSVAHVLPASAGVALDKLALNPKGFVLLVEDTRIEQSLQQADARAALDEVVRFDAAVEATMKRLQSIDPGLAHTLVVVTADHDHALAITGYPKRGNPILEINRSYTDGKPARDADGKTFATLVLAAGPNRPGLRSDVDGTAAPAESVVRLPAEVHGGGDVKLFATGAGSAALKGTITNTRVIELLQAALQK